MKKVITALLFIPMISTAQRVDVSLKAGACFNNQQQPFNGVYETSGGVGFAVSAAATAKLFAGFRAGLSLSLYSVSVSYNNPSLGYSISRNGYADKASYGSPLMLAEAVALYRFPVRSFSFDVGASFGAFTTSRANLDFTEQHTSTEIKYSKGWTAYGAIIAAQYKVNNLLSVGIEVQPKKTNITDVMTEARQMAGGRVLSLVPVMAKVSINL